MLERFVAGIVVIGLLLWGASILATPRDASLAEPDVEPEPRGSILPSVDEPVASAPRSSDGPEDDDDEGDEDDRESDGSSTDRKGKDKGPD